MLPSTSVPYSPKNSPLRFDDLIVILEIDTFLPWPNVPTSTLGRRVIGSSLTFALDTIAFMILISCVDCGIEFQINLKTNPTTTQNLNSKDQLQ
jgi:hypothetical protein